VNIHEAVAALNTKTVALAALYQTRGDTLQVKIKAVNAAWENGRDMAVTERRETARAAGSQFDAMVAKDDGDIQALEVERDYLKVLIDVMKAGLMP
jgi:hypothetical protein